MSETTASDGTGSREKINYEEQDLIDTFMGREHTRWAPGQYEAGYHNDWNYLMPVVEKIEDSGFQVEILHNETAIRQGMTLRTIVLTGDKTKITSVYSAVVEFIKWYQNSNHHD